MPAWQGQALPLISLRFSHASALHCLVLDWHLAVAAQGPTWPHSLTHESGASRSCRNGLRAWYAGACTDPCGRLPPPCSSAGGGAGMERASVRPQTAPGHQQLPWFAALLAAGLPLLAVLLGQAAKKTLIQISRLCCRPKRC